MEAYRTYTPMNPEAPENKAAVIISFVNQSAADIKRKLQKVDRLGEKSLQDLLAVAEKVYNNRESPEDRQARVMAATSSRQARDLARVLLATTMGFLKERDRRLRQLASNKGRGRDLLTKIGAQITFRQGGPQVTDGEGRPIQVLTMRLEDEYRLYQKTSLVEGSMDKWLQEFPTAWAETGGVGLAAHRAPVLVELKPGEGPVRIKQYPMPQEARKGIQPQSQSLFAFEWHDPEEGFSGQLTWTRLPQGFKNSPTIFDEALHEDLGEYRREHPNLTLLQYVDDILIAADTAKDCERGTQDLLATLGALGYRASARKAQLCRERSLLLNPPRVRFHPSAALNPATLLPDPDLDAPLHDCAGILEQVHGLRKDLTDRPLPDAEATWFTDGSSFVRDGCRYAGAAVVTETDTVWVEALPSGTSAQQAELIALTKALTLGTGKRLNVYTDSRYAFATAHVHGAIYQERGLLTAEGWTIKNKQEILDLLAALWLPAKLAIIHCQGHQKADDPVARGNQKADQAAKAVALTSVPTMALQLPDPGDPVLPDQPKYSQEELQRIRKLPRTQEIKGWWHTPEGELILPDRLGDTVAQNQEPLKNCLDLLAKEGYSVTH
ncbi:uncharacterized protein LOC132213925 [Myotis daubentonii]|uniref:uncharacterized protein LOC132213925 n=1 Tax=Myotis daubentonii TaxID=98922 RepID=UPI002872B224|nr:uncharacterized protein LOC132213925 [Myotis daubentonii]